jgi:hypothetical protein
MIGIGAQMTGTDDRKQSPTGLTDPTPTDPTELSASG